LINPASSPPGDDLGERADTVRPARLVQSSGGPLWGRVAAPRLERSRCESTTSSALAHARPRPADVGFHARSVPVARFVLTTDPSKGLVQRRRPRPDRLDGGPHGAELRRILRSSGFGAHQTCCADDLAMKTFKLLHGIQVRASLTDKSGNYCMAYSRTP